MIADEQCSIVTYENYGPLRDYPTDKPVIINTDDITPDNWDDYFIGTFNILRDMIEQPIVREKKIRVQFGDTGMGCNLFITDWLINIQMWYCIIYAEQKIMPYHLLRKPDGIKTSDVKEFIDKYFILENRKLLPFRLLNNIIDDTLYNWMFLNEFSNFLADTLNLKDYVDLCRINPEYYDLLHSDLSGYSIDESNKVAIELTGRMMEIERNAYTELGHDHCMANSHRSDACSKKTLKEGFVYVGPKPDGTGNVYSHPINKSYITGATNDIADFFIDSALARIAQIISHKNVGDSGHFGRILGLNNSGTFISKDIDHCDSRRLLHITLKTLKHVEAFFDRYVKFSPDGGVHLIQQGDYSALGKEIWVYSPMTCNSHTHSKGICHRCYGELYVINSNINSGKMSAELLSRELTQRMLSAKHLLEAIVKAIRFCQAFYKFFTTEFNYIKLKDDEDIDGTILINPEDIEIDNEDDYLEDGTGEISEYISSFIVVSNGKQYEIKDEDGREFYISNQLNKYIRKHAVPEGDMISIPLSYIEEDMPIFYFRIRNNEISKTLNRLKDIINKKNVIDSFDLDGILQEFIDTIVEGKIDLRAIHCEIILSNQIYNPVDLSKCIDWSNPMADYRLQTINNALLNNPSPTITLMYQNLAKVLYTPLTYEKHGPSFLDLFFMKYPQKFIDSEFAKKVYDSEVQDNSPWTVVIPPDEQENNLPWDVVIPK